MIGLILKLIVCPIVLVLADLIIPGIDYVNLYQPILTGLFLAVSAHLMELLILRKGNFWISTGMDFLAAFIIIYLSQFIFRNASITFSGAIITSILLTVTEYLQHLYLIRTGKTKKVS